MIAAGHRGSAAAADGAPRRRAAARARDLGKSADDLPCIGAGDLDLGLAGSRGRAAIQERTCSAETGPYSLPSPPMIVYMRPESTSGARARQPLRHRAAHWRGRDARGPGDGLAGEDAVVAGLQAAQLGGPEGALGVQQLEIGDDPVGVPGLRQGQGLLRLVDERVGVGEPGPGRVQV